ncbi:nuclear pore complex protein NUP214 isoform X2 [Phoenix dactylifera]|uniref:Nuclear pore complex protein NUP214 isoform X2 n=1 Tax=Phoenix dactylifera TaxID=42345 RepID=A0A8B8J5Y5_PHODC|nr:nuclear pore complex protein NUP214 isoform X2 [Phoenix dactylifera]
MAEEPEDHLIRLEEEIEGDRGGTTDFVFSRIGESVPLKPSDSGFDLQNPPSRPLAVSERFGVLFLAHSEGFLVAKTQDVIGLAKEIKEKGKGPCVQNSSVVDVRIGRVSILALSGDSSTLAATVGGEIHLFSVPSLLEKEQEPSFSCSIKKSSIVKDLKWKKNAEESFVVLSSHGLLYRGHLKEQLKDVMDNVDAVDWSVEGDFIAITRKNTLSILSSNFEEQLGMSLLFQSWTSDADTECTIKVDSIEWVRDDSIIIGCFRVNEDGIEEGYLVQVITSKERKFTEETSKLVIFSFPDLFEGILDDILPTGLGPYLLSSYLDHWELVLAANKKNIDQHVRLLKWSEDDNTREVVFLEFQNDKYTPRVDLQENGNDNLILGFGVDKVSVYEKVKIQLDLQTKELSPRCIVLCLTCEGKLIMYHVARISEPSDLPQSSLLPTNDYKAEKVRLSTNTLLENELPATTSRPKDDIDGLVSNDRIKQITTEASIVDTSKELKSIGNKGTCEVGRQDHMPPGRKEQSCGGSLFGSGTGQVLNFNQLPVESPQIQGPGLALRDDAKPGMQELNLSLPGKGASTTSMVDGISSEATWQARAKSVVKSSEAGKGLFSLNKTEGVSYGPPATGKSVAADGFSAKSLALASGGSFPSNTQEKAEVGLRNKSLSFSSNNRLSADLPSSANLKGSSRESSSLMFSYKAAQNEGVTAPWTKTGNAETVPTVRGSVVMEQERTMVGKPVYSRVQPSLDNFRTSKSPQMLDPEPALSKEFYNVKDMTKELDTLLSFIEREDGFRDACTVFQQSSLLALEEGLQNLSALSGICRSKVEQQLMEIQELQNKMLQVSARQLYMEGIVRQASNGKYWDIWNQQKLSPEFELKRQQILNANQKLTNQLIELERHFNSLEINRFGESGRVPPGRRAFRNSMGSSRHIQSLHSVYNTLNSQLAAAEQLSQCLSKQMTMLNINSPSVKRASVTTELFESIGLAHEADAFQSPDTRRIGLAPDSVKRISPLTFTSSNERPRRSTLSVLKGFEPETARRRRDSLDKSWASFEPRKTTVKRASQQERLRVNAINPFRKTKEEFDSQMEALAIIQQKSNGTPVSSSSVSSASKFQSHAYTQGSLFKWAKELSGSSQTLISKSYSNQETQISTQPLTLVAPSPSLFSHAQSNEKFDSPNWASIGVARMGSQSSWTANSVSIPKTVSNIHVGTSTPMSTSTIFSSSMSPVKATLTVEANGQASKQLNLSTREDNLAKTFPGNMKQEAISPQSLSASSKESNISSLSSVSSIWFPDASQSTAQTEKITSRIQSTETASTVAPRSRASVSTSSLPFSFSAAHTLSSISTPTAPSLAPSILSAVAFGESSFKTNSIAETIQATSVSASTLVASCQSSLSSSQSQKLLFSLPSMSSADRESSAPSHPNEANSLSEQTPSQAPIIEVSSHMSNVTSKLEPATSQTTASEASVGLAFDKKPSSVPATSGSLSNTPPMTQADLAPPVSTTAIETNGDYLDTVSQEDEMEEEAPVTSNVLNFGALGGFGLGSTPPSSAAKTNPFGGSIVAANTSIASPPFTLTATPGELFRPPSLNLPSAQPVQPPESLSSGAFSGGGSGGFSGFGQPAQIGAGQQALGSVLGAFGQSRQLGAGVQGFGFASAGAFNGGGFSAAATGGGFASLASKSGGFAGAATGGGFAAVASTGGGFAGAATGGGFAALASSGGGFSGAGAGGFAAVASASGGFAGAASTGGGFGGGGFPGGGFGGFSSNQAGGFSAFGGNSAAGRTPADILTQMRR